MNSGISIFFLNQAEKPVVLTGTSFNVEEASSQEIRQDSSKLATETIWPLKKITIEVPGNKRWVTVYHPDKLHITGGAMVSSYTQSYQNAHTVHNISVSQYNEAFLAAVQNQQPGKMLILDLIPIQRQNAEAFKPHIPRGQGC
ncbi:MAG: hypothetical protein J0L77_09185 [Alphaproteobacteria bacterium]|nr:hypothetical protein [Alphaproteobacteria bacterium]